MEGEMDTRTEEVYPHPRDGSPASCATTGAERLRPESHCRGRTSGLPFTGRPQLRTPCQAAPTYGGSSCCEEGRRKGELGSRPHVRRPPVRSSDDRRPPSDVDRALAWHHPPVTRLVTRRSRLRIEVVR